MNRQKKALLFLLVSSSFFCNVFAQENGRTTAKFNSDWSFHAGDMENGEAPGISVDGWRTLNLPHDWSIEGEFKKDNPATPEGGALPGGIAWYRKSFTVPATSQDKKIYVDFDGIYQKSDVWINGHHLGFRPNGYISFRYDLTPYLKFGSEKNVLAVKVDNSKQPNSRWYSGSGIYRNVWLVTTNKIAVDHWGTFVTTPAVTTASASVSVVATIMNSGPPKVITISTTIYDAAGKMVATKTSAPQTFSGNTSVFKEQLNLDKPILWSVDNPYLYKVVTSVQAGRLLYDKYETSLGIRYFNFDADKGFSLNGKPLKILGVCDHHDLGALGAAINTRAIQRQLEILKAMGANGIRTSHNPPAPELLDLCDKMGFIVMDEAFDAWQLAKKPYDYHLYFKEWHKRDLEDQVLRDRNHPSVFMWSIGNEIREQSDTSGFRIARDLAGIIHALDTTRPLTSANNDPSTKNQIIQSGAVDLVGYNYHFKDLASFNRRYPGKKFIGTETTSAIETRGIYDMPSDSILRWSTGTPLARKNADYTVSSYDNVSVPWGSTHEETWKIIKKYDFLSGMYIWTGFDYLGEPTPYTWPARSSYFGIIDLAGIPKDSYYMYQSEWTDKTVLHVFPHWNWAPGKVVDVWAYYNHADEVELFLNGKSLGVRKKQGDDLHVFWRISYVPGTIRVVSRSKENIVLTKEIKTAGKPSRIILVADRKLLKADGEDLSFVTVKVVDKDGLLVPDANNLVNFSLTGEAQMAGVDNGDPVSHEPFKATYRKAFNGLAIAIIQTKNKAGKITLQATSPGLQASSITIESKL